MYVNTWCEPETPNYLSVSLDIFPSLSSFRSSVTIDDVDDDDPGALEKKLIIDF